MNERIEQLAEQCWISDGGEDRYFSYRKFAELLEQEFFTQGYIAGKCDGIHETARECIDIFGRDLPEPGDARMTEVIDRICRVAEHFAVEK